MLDIILDIQRKVTESSMATRHASSISAQDLNALEAALRITFVPVNIEALEPDISASLQDPEEFIWEQNKHEAKHKKEDLDQLQQQVWGSMPVTSQLGRNLLHPLGFNGVLALMCRSTFPATCGGA
jgi:hypothetical protein